MKFNIASADDLKLSETSGKNFGVLLKGTSLNKVREYSTKFSSCFIVSDFDDELASVGAFIQGKEIVHFTNRSKQAQLSASSYKKFGITQIQTSVPFTFKDYKLHQARASFFLKQPKGKFYYLPDELSTLSSQFGPAYKRKFPNTGVMSILFALYKIKPKNLWIFGLDLYERPYSVAQSRDPGISLQEQKFKIDRLGLKHFLFDHIRSCYTTKVHLATLMSDVPDLRNVERL